MRDFYATVLAGEVRPYGRYCARSRRRWPIPCKEEFFNNPTNGPSAPFGGLQADESKNGNRKTLKIYARDFSMCAQR